MLSKLHRRLRKQLKKELGLDSIPEELGSFIKAVDETYNQFDIDRQIVERSIENSSREYTERAVELREAKDYLTNLIKAIPQGIIIIDVDCKISMANSAAERIFDLPLPELIGKRLNNSRWRLLTLEGLPPIREELPPGLIERSQEPVVRTEYTITRGKHEQRVLYVAAAKIQNSASGNNEFILSVEDITTRKKMERQLKYLSLHDALTGLYNRAFFEEEMHRLSSGRFSPAGIVVADIDGLKLVNDTLGHEQGDQLLRAAAELIKNAFRDDDVVARIGGDEFAVLLAFCSKEELEDYCHKLRQEVQEYNNQCKTGLPFSISVGFAVSNQSGANMPELFKEADNHMYRDKLYHRQSVRNAVVETLNKAMEARDFSTGGHAGRLQNWAVMLAEALGLEEGKIADIRLFAQFHDIGKVGIPDRILHKPGPLTKKERTEMNRHCEIGYRIAEASIDLAPISDWILKHHEWWNGQGYPLGLKEGEIPLECRILAVADAYDAMTSDRPYRKAMSHEKAVEELCRGAGIQFDPEVVEQFLLIKNCDKPIL